MANIAFGGQPSPYDYRDHKDQGLTLAVPYPQQYAVPMDSIPVFYQDVLGICTAAALCAAIVEYQYWKKTGVYTRLSVAFLYLATKRFIDGDTREGSSLRSALKAALKYGICTEATFPTYVDMPYSDFIKQAIPKAAWTEALNYAIGGYISIPVDQSLIAAAMYKYGPLYARFEVGPKWYTPTWLEKDISPLQPISLTNPLVSGHATALTAYDLTTGALPMWLRNSWGGSWFRNGDGMFNFRDYKPTEVWAITLDSTMHLASDSQPFSLSPLFQGLLSVLRKIGVI